MLPDLKMVIQLQGLDARIGDLDKEVSLLPKHVAEIEKALESHTRKLEADRAALTANQKDRKKLEGEIQTQEQKISKLRDQMLQAKTNEVYRAFQHEISFCEAEIRKCEDRILDLMGASEPLEQNVKAAETALKQEKVQVDAEKKKAQDRSAEDKKQLDLLNGERQGIAASVSKPVYSTYERIRKKWHGVAVADATEGRCSACHMSLRPQFFQDLRRGEQIMTCENCGRILFYNPPVSFDDQIQLPAAAEASRPAGV